MTYTSPATSDAVDGASTASCLPASGTTFALGNTTVTGGNFLSPIAINSAYGGVTDFLGTGDFDVLFTLQDMFVMADIGPALEELRSRLHPAKRFVWIILKQFGSFSRNRPLLESRYPLSDLGISGVKLLAVPSSPPTTVPA